MKCPQCSKEYGSRVNRCPDCACYLTKFSDPGQIEVKAAWSLSGKAAKKPNKPRATEPLRPVKLETVDPPTSTERLEVAAKTERLEPSGQAGETSWLQPVELEKEEKPKPGSGWLAPPTEPLAPKAPVGQEDWLDELLPEAEDTGDTISVQQLDQELPAQTVKVEPKRSNQGLTGVAAILMVGLLLASLSMWANRSPEVEPAPAGSQQVMSAREYLENGQADIAVVKAREGLADAGLTPDLRRDLKGVLALALLETGEFGESVALFEELGQEGASYQKAVSGRDKAARVEAVQLLDQASARLKDGRDAGTARREAEYAKSLLIDHQGDQQQLARAYYLTAITSWEAGDVVAAESNMKRAAQYDASYKSELKELVASLEPAVIRRVPKSTRPPEIPQEYETPRKVVRELPRAPYPKASPKPVADENEPFIGTQPYRPAPPSTQLPAVRRPQPQPPEPPVSAPAPPRTAQAPVIRKPNIPEPSWKGDHKVYNGYVTPPWKKTY